MIKDIKELNFPSYATLSQATCALQDMAEKTITTQVKIDGAITPDFSYDWEIVFKREKYIQPLRKPQAAKENTSLKSVVDLTFQHWAIYQLKRWMFFTLQPIESGTAVADQYIASVSLNLKEFCDLFGQVLQYYYGDSITIDLNPEWQYKTEPTGIEINYSYLWDILIKLYELYAVRWQIEPAVSNDNETKGGEKYVIKIGYPATELSHIFQYGFEGGLLKTEQQVQSEDIRNMLLGRGGEKNLPYRYFKDVDEENPSFPADPDWIPELANIYFPELRGATFRSYVQGWKAKHYGGTTTKEDSYAPWAWEKGYTDSKFIPIEYVKDDVSITKYGELLGGLENNNEIYPSIQGITLSPYGRIDEVVDVEQIESDDVEESSEAEAKILDVKGITAPIIEIEGNGRVTQTVIGNTFTVPAGLYGNFDEGAKTIKVSKTKILKDVKPIFINGKLVDLDVEETEIVIEVEGTPIQIESASVRVRNTSTGELLFASGIPEGTYRYEITYGLYNTSDEKLYAELSFEAPEAKVAKIQEQWGNTFDIWIKNIWGTRKLDHGETDEQYTEKVWGPILGDRQGNEAKVVFASGMLSTSEDYEFTIVDVNYDTSKSIAVKDEQGETVQTVQSEWRLTLSKSDADLESLGLYVPSTMRQGKAGDFFFFTGIDMPHKYVVWAEERIDDYKKDQLAQVCEIKPAWVVSLDKIRINNPLQGEAETILSALHVGSSLRLADSRFIINDEGSEAAYETLYLQSITYTYNEPTSDNAALMPDVEIVLSDKYETTASPVETMQGTIDAIQRQVGSISNIQQLIRAVGDKLYLRKDGISDRSMSPTKFFSLLTSGDFRNGIVGGQGWGLFKDENGNWVLEVDKVNIRKELQANNTVINQVTFRSGMTVQSAANIEAERVVETDEGYVCYFSQKGGNVANLFHVEDIAYSQRYTPENATLKYYKRKVIAVGSGSITLSKDSEYVDGSGIPEAGDNIVQFGNYIDATRQYAIVRDVIGGGYERYIEGLNSVKATGTEYYFVGKQNGENARWFVGNKSGDFIEWLNGKLNIKGSLSVESTIGEQSLNDYINSKIEINADNIQDYIKNIVNPLLEELQKQIDGAIETWFLPGEPTLENEPASQWTTDELKNVHLGDLYYDKKSGKCYRFQLDNDGSYYWQVITDTAIQAALDAAAKAQDTADGKRKVFVNQPTANDDYDIGDLWVNATYGDLYDNDVLRCNTPKAKGVAFSIEHWEKASKYTDDTVANQALSIAKGLSSNVEAAQNAVNMLRQYVDGAFSDSIISESEAKTIRAYLKNINTAAEDVSRSYAEVYANPLLPAKTKEALAEAKAAFDAATQTLISQINIAIEDGQISNEERASVDNAYNTFTTEYGDFRTAITKSINAILDLLNSNIAGLDYIKKALKQSTAIQGGLILSSLISLGINNEDYSTQETYSGINGIYDSSKRGGGIAAWYGGDMIDIFDYYNSETQKFEIPEKDSNENVIRPAKGVDRMDGSGYRANGALWWDTNGVVHADPLSFFVGEEQVGALLASFQVVYEEPEEGKIEPSYLIPKVPFQNLGVVGLLSAETIKIGSAYIKWDATNNALYVEGEDGATVGFYSKGWLSALGINGDTGGSVNYDRLDSWPTTWSDSYNTYVLSAKLGQDLRERIEELKNGGVFSITPEGTGNAVTEIAKNGTSGIIVTKGLTFALQENVVTDIGVSVKSLTWTKNEEVQSLTVPYATLAKQFDTKYTLWGQSFQGNNVSGNMSNVGNVSPNANNTYTSGTSTLRWKNVYAQLLDVKGLATLTGGLSIGSYGITSLGVATLKSLISESFKATVGNVETLTSEQATLTKLKVSGEADLILKSLVSNGFIGGNDGKGVSVSETQNGAFRMEIDELLVRKIATLLKLEIRELSYVGGNIVLSKAGNEITKVESVVGGWKCYFTTNDGSKEVENLWKAGDQARCQTVNLKEGTNDNAGNKYYWRLVTETGDDYVVLSSSDKDDTTDNDNPNCVPAVGDKIVQMGFRLSGDEGDKDRTSLILLSTSGENTPSIEAYTGITAYELGAEKRLFILSPGEVSFRSDMFRWMSGGVKFPQVLVRGDWESGEAYSYYDEVSHGGSTWICISPEGTTEEPGTGDDWQLRVSKGDQGAQGEQGPAGADGKDGVGVASVDVLYYLSSSSSSLTGGSWSTDAPAWADGKYMWSKTKVVYTDGSSKETAAVCITGAKGATGGKGATGAAGKGVKSIVEQYYLSSSSTSQSGGNWGTSVPVWADGKYMWTRSVITYTDGSSVTTNAVCVTGGKGATGAAGETLLGGKMLFTDPEFKDGYNSVVKYTNDNANARNLTVERLESTEETDIPTESGYFLRVTTTSAQNPGYGGVCQLIHSRPNAVFIQKLIAKIPKGYRLEIAFNSFGSGSSYKWLTDRLGTGKYETYLFKSVCGSTGSFSSIGFFYLSGLSGVPAPSEESPLVWDIAYLTAFDLTADGYGQITDEINASLAKTVQVTADGQVFRYGAGYTGNPSPASITLTAEAKNFEPKSWQWQYLDGTSWKTISNATGSTYIVEPGNTTLFGTGVYVRTLRCVCDGDESKSDTFTLAKLADGAPGTEGKDAYSVLLTNESHTFAGDASGAVAGSAECGVAAYKGSQRVAATIGTITGMPAGMSVKISDNGTTGAKFAVTVTTALTTRQGVLTVPVTVDGVQFEKRFSFSLALAGAGYSPNMLLGSKSMSDWRLGTDNKDRVRWNVVNDEETGRCVKQTVTADGTVDGFFFTTIPNILTTAANRLFTPGKEYTLSFDYKATANIQFGFRISTSGSPQSLNYVFPTTVFPASADWKRASMTVVAPDGTDGEEWAGALGIMTLVSSRVAGDEAYFRKVCLIEGTNTQWVPAASEMVGVDGVSVTAVKNMYKAGTSSTEAPGGTYVADVMQAGFSETNKYLWGYEINTLSDGKTIETTKHLVSVWGQTGNPGTDGTKIIPAELTTAFNATYVQWLTLYNQTVGKVWNVDNASDYRVGDIAVITGNVTDRGNIKASLYASVITVNTTAGTIGTRSYSLVVGNQGEQGVPGSSGIDAKRNLLLNSGVEQTVNAGTYMVARYDISPTEGVQGAGHTGSLVEGEKYTVVMCFTPKSVNSSPLRLYSTSNKIWIDYGVPKSGKHIYKNTFTCSYNSGYEPNGTRNMDIRLYYGAYGSNPDTYLGGTVHWIKLVKGETATDEWTPAPEDSDVFDVQVSPSELSFKPD